MSAPILPSLAIDPVVSSTSATRNRDAPHFAVDVAVRFIVLKPSMRMNSVSISADAEIAIWEPAVAE